MVMLSLYPPPRRFASKWFLTFGSGLGWEGRDNPPPPPPPRQIFDIAYEHSDIGVFLEQKFRSLNVKLIIFTILKSLFSSANLGAP